MAQSHAVTGSVQGAYTAVSCMPCTDEETFNYVRHPVGTTMSENGPSNKFPLKATNSDEKLKKAEESTQRPTVRPVADKKGTPSKHEAHACKQVPPMAQSHAVTGSVQGAYSAVFCMPCTDEEIFVYGINLKKAEESTQRPTTRPVADKKGAPSKHEAHACKQVPSMAQSHTVTGSVQGTDTAVSCIPCGHGCYRCQRCEKCSSCGNKDVLVNCSINRVAVCSKSCKSKTHYFNESVIQCYPSTKCCGKDKVNIEPVPLKRKEKDSGAPAGKSVMVLKSSDVTIRNNSVFMPNTIEMARLKKKENGQFVTNVQISSKMSQQDIRELLISLFHYLGDQRFYCASVEDNRTRLDFHGELRIWDGHLIKQRIKGNSALYIFTDEGSLRKQDSSTRSKQPTLKRSHDQMTPTMKNGCSIDKDDATTIAQGGILVQAAIAQKIILTASDPQTKDPPFHTDGGDAEAMNNILSKSSSLPHTELQGMISSSLTPQLNSLNIAKTAKQERRQLWQTTAGGYNLEHGPLEASTRQGQGNGAATRVQEGITCNSTDHSKRGSVVNAEFKCAGKSGSVSNVTDAHHEDAGTSGSDCEETVNEPNSISKCIDGMFQRRSVDVLPPEASKEEADKNKEGGSAISWRLCLPIVVPCKFKFFVRSFVCKQFRTTAEFVDNSGFTIWSSSEDNDLDHFGSRDFSFAGHPAGQDGPGEDEFLLSEESIQRLRNVALKDPKRKSLRHRRRPVTTHETLYRYIIATETTAFDYLDTLSLITTGTCCKSGDFAKPSRYPCNLSTNVDEGLYRRWSLCQDGTSSRPSLVKTAEKADQHSRVSTKLKQIADEIGAERGSCRRVDAQVYEIRSPTPFVPTRPLIQCQLQDFKDRIV